MRMNIAPIYRDALRTAVIQSVVIVTLAALMLDRGELARACLIAMVVFWGWVVVAIYRRPDAPTTMDLSLICWGVPVGVIGIYATVWLLRYVVYWYIY